jgi:regulator of RNase E activity RraA
MAGGTNIGFRVKLNYEKPDPDQLKAFEGWSTGNICDANGRLGAMDYRIKPLNPDWHFIGVAFTVRARPVDNLIVYKALDLAGPGDVLVITNDSSSNTSILGDLVCAIAKSKGVAAIVTDGLVRDAAGIRELGLPVFALGISPNSPYKDGPGEVNFPISCGGLSVHPGDVILGDEDGVVVVAREDVSAVLGELRKVGAKEQEMRAKIEAGWTLPAWMEEALSIKGVQVIDEREKHG